MGGGNEIIIRNRCRFRNLVIEVIGNNNKIIVGENVFFYEKGYVSIKGDNCIFTIDNNTTVGSSSFFMEESNTTICIGQDCMLGRNISISTTDFHSIIDKESGERLNKAEDIIIGDHVWVGYSVSFGKGTSVGNNCVIGEHSLVTKKFHDDNVIIAGIPAKVIKSGIDWKREKI